MGVYHEPRVPQGTPAVDEHDVWLDNGSVIWGHWNGTAWVVDATADASGLVGVQGPEGDPCPTGGEADTLDGYHINSTHDAWQAVTPGSGWSATYFDGVCKYPDGLAWLNGQMVYSSTAYTIGTIPAGYRPTKRLHLIVPFANSTPSEGPIHIQIDTTGVISICSMYGMSMAGTGYVYIHAFYQTV